MTREEAIEELKAIRSAYSDKKFHEERLMNSEEQALEMAIKALSQEPKMTLDEAIKHAEEVADSRCDECGQEHAQLAEWLKELKAYKEQEPCTDAVRRQDAIEAVKQAIYNHDSAIMRLTELPSVTQKSGKWIDYRDEGFVECPFCGHVTNCEDDIDELHYCFYCGAKMVEPQESEDKE